MINSNLSIISSFPLFPHQNTIHIKTPSIWVSLDSQHHLSEEPIASPAQALHILSKTWCICEVQSLFRQLPNLSHLTTCSSFPSSSLITPTAIQGMYSLCCLTFSYQDHLNLNELDYKYHQLELPQNPFYAMEPFFLGYFWYSLYLKF